MRITLSWLKRFLDTEASLQEIIDALINAGIEVEKVVNNAETHEKFIIVEIQHIERHPNADNLWKCKVFDGQKTLDIICGAENAKIGLKTVLAPIGTLIPKSGIVIKETAIRGEVSQGMLCSAVELCLSNEATGIIELGIDAVAGNKYIDYIGMNDPIIDLKVTPNRGDCLGVYGIARDLSAADKGILKDVIIPEIKSTFPSPIKVSITDKKLCSHYAGRYIKNVQNKQSPKWLENLLNQVGIRSVSALVDVTNYINLSFARPLHVFDADALSGELSVKAANENDSILVLSGDYKQLTPEITVIADRKGPVAIAGIMGGIDSACTMTTKNIFLESANFPAKSIIKSGRSLKLESDSRFRFERGIDQEFIVKALNLATQMIIDICGGEASEVEEVITEKYEPRFMDFSYYILNSKIGKFIEHTKFENIVSKLGFDILHRSPEKYKLKIPSWRNDISIPEDIVEEVVRINGLDKIGIIPLPGMETLARDSVTDQYKIQQKIRTILASRGLHEVYTWSFIDEKIAQYFQTTDTMIKIKNPINSELGVMRETVVPNLMKVIKQNEQYSTFDLCVFEIGPVFFGYEPENQFYTATIARSGMVDRNHYMGQRFYSWDDVKHDLDAILQYFKIQGDIRLDLVVPKWYHPARSGRILLGKQIIGYFGEINPSISKIYETKQNIFVAELFLQNISLARTKIKFRGPLFYSNYQTVERKLSFLVPFDLFSSDLVSVARSVDKKVVKEVKVFDYVTKLPKLEEDYRIVGLAITLQSDTATLTTEVIDDIIARIKTKVEATGAKFRNA